MGLFGKNKEVDLFEAADEGNSHKVKKLLGKGVSPNSKVQDDHTPLMAAAFSGYSDIVRILGKL